MASVTCRAPFAALGRIFTAGQEVDASDPVVRRFPAQFDAAAPVVEQATAAPGEVRTTPAKKKAAPRKATAKKKA